MSCIKTGAWVYFVAHGFLARCDVYQLTESYIFRWNRLIPEEAYITQSQVPAGTWIVDNRSDLYTWHREDLGVTVADKIVVLPGERC